MVRSNSFFDKLEKLPFVGKWVVNVRAILVYVGIYLHMMAWMITKELWTPHVELNLNDISDVSGRVAVVTGGNRGIGSEIVRKLLQLKMKVIVGCRDPKDGQKLLNQFRKDGLTTGTTEFLALDLTSLSSVRSFAEEVLNKKVPIHLLVNNAGIMGVPFKITPDQHESHFQVNYLSHFLLTNLLLQNMIEAASDRKAPVGQIVNVSAIMIQAGKLDFDDLELRKRYNPLQAYANSKLFQVLMSRNLDAKLHYDGSKVRINSVHPGVVATDLLPHGAFGKWVVERIMMSPAQGADDVLYVALRSEAPHFGGEFFTHQKLYTKGSEYFSPRLERKLWEVSERLVGLEDKALI